MENGHQIRSLVILFLFSIAKLKAQTPLCDSGFLVKVNDSINLCVAKNISARTIRNVYCIIDSNRAISLNYYNPKSIKNIVAQLTSKLGVIQTFAYKNKISTHTEYIKTDHDSIQANGMKYVFYPEGGIKYIYTYELGILNGKFLSYWENGYLKETGFYKNNEKYGLWKYYASNGKLQKSMTF